MAPSPFIVQWTPTLALRARPPRRALDVAMGHGRHSMELARSGFRTFGIDWRLDAVRHAVAGAADVRLTVRGWCADLTVYPLPPGRFELVVVTRYLQRDLFASIRDTITRDGFVLYETFTERQRSYGVGPTSPDHLLREGELRGWFHDFDVLFYEEISAPEAVARLVARKP